MSAPGGPGAPSACPPIHSPPHPPTLLTMVSLRAPSWSPAAPVQETQQAQKMPTLTGTEDSNCPQTLMFCRKRKRKGPEVKGSTTKPTLAGTEDSNRPQSLLFCRKRKRKGPEVKGRTGSEREIQPEIGRENSGALRQAVFR
ncbi:hypothetical protein H8959_008213 [Pygathrix nigripes]